MKRFLIPGLLLVIFSISTVYGVDIKVINPKSGFPEGPLWHKDKLYYGQYSKGRIVVVSPDKKLVRTIDVPSPAAPNLCFGPDEKVVYIMAVDDQSNAPYWGKVYEVPNK
jgi:sugar lactone lactonase YvrE